jgi:hypothetical protein
MELIYKRMKSTLNTFSFNDEIIDKTKNEMRGNLH